MVFKNHHCRNCLYVLSIAVFSIAFMKETCYFLLLRQRLAGGKGQNHFFTALGLLFFLDSRNSLPGFEKPSCILSLIKRSQKDNRVFRQD